MERIMETMWTFKTNRFEVRWSIDEPYSLDLSWDDTGETARKLDSGEYTAFDSTVAVYLDGVEIGRDTLGDSIYENPADFRDHFGIAHTKYGSYFSSMVDESIKRAREFMASVPA
jgi:hypothetical protein